MTGSEARDSRWGALRRLLPAGSWKSATLWLAVGVNVVLIGLYLWSRQGSTVDVRLEANGAAFTAEVDGRLVGHGRLGGPARGGLGFAFGRSGNNPALPGPVGIDWVRVTDLDSGAVLLEDGFDGEPSSIWKTTGGPWHTEGGVYTPEGGRGSISTGAQPWRNYAVEAKLRNPTDVSVFVREQKPDSRFSFDLRAFQSYRTAFRLTQNGESVQRGDGSRMELDRVETVRSMLAMLLRPYPLALAMVAAAIALAFAVRIGWLERTLLRLGRSLAANGGSLVAVFALWSVVFLWYLLYVVGDAMPHVPDDTAYMFQSKIFASLRLTADQPPAFESFSFFHPPMFKLVDGRWFSQYPFGHPLILSIGQLFHAVWLVPPIVGTLCVVLIYLLGKRIYGTLAGLVAAGLLLFSPFFEMTASNFMSHNTAAFTILACLFFLTRPLKNRLLSMFLSGLFVGLLFNIRPLSAVAFMAVLAGFLAYELLRAGDQRKQVFQEQLALGAGGLVMLAAYFGYNLGTTGDILKSPYALQGTYSENTFGFGGSHSLAVGLQNQQAHLALLLLVAHGWPVLFGLVFAILPFALGTRHRWDYFMLASFVAVAGAQVFYVRAPIMHGPRFWYETMPFLMLLSARGVQLLIERSGAVSGAIGRALGVSRQPGIGVTGTAVLGLVAGLVAFSSWGWMLEKRDAWSGVQFTPQKISKLEGFNFTDDRLWDTAEEMDVHDALVLVDKCSQWWCYGSVFWRNNVDLDGDIVWAERQGNEDDLRLLDHYPDRDLYVANYDVGTIEPVTHAAIEESVLPVETATPQATNVAAAQRRDERRTADLESLRAPLEEYKRRFGEYPNTHNEIQTLCLYRADVACGLKAVLPALPRDPLGGSATQGYWYTSDGTEWTLIAQPELISQAQTDCPAFVVQRAVGNLRYCVRGPAS